MNDAIVGVSGNIDPSNQIPAALQRLDTEFSDVRTAPIYATPAIGRPNEEDYWNTACRFTTSLDREALAARLHALEAAAGRQRTDDPYASRTLDLDIMTWNGDPPDASTAEELASRPWNPWLLHHLDAGPKPDHAEPARAR